MRDTIFKSSLTIRIPILTLFLCHDLILTSKVKMAAILLTKTSAEIRIRPPRNLCDNSIKGKLATKIPILTFLCHALIMTPKFKDGCHPIDKNFFFPHQNPSAIQNPSNIHQNQNPSTIPMAKNTFVFLSFFVAYFTCFQIYRKQLCYNNITFSRNIDALPTFIMAIVNES